MADARGRESAWSCFLRFRLLSRGLFVSSKQLPALVITLVIAG
jgi:hypothetical protein